VEFISFSIGDEQYGVDIMAVREIKGWTEITHLPKQPEYVRGVLNLRGVMVPIIDLRCRFGQGKTEATALHIVIVVQVEARLIGLLADRVLDILAFEATQVQHRWHHDCAGRSSQPSFRAVRRSGLRKSRTEGCRGGLISTMSTCVRIAADIDTP
jgi:chemotaxis signal transduction protein